jgi:Winged helix DNA-binding domain
MTRTGSPAAKLTWDGVLTWRMRRQLIDPVGAAGIVDTVRRLCGVQAQVPSSAELALALRSADPQAGGAARALAERALMRTWAMRGTLHLLAPDDAGAYLALIAARRTWERPAWQRNFGASAAEVQTLADVVDDVLDGTVMDRDELIAAVAERTGNRDLDEHLRSGWGVLLKPLAWMGLICNGPSRGNRVTFTSPRSWLPEWGGLPDTDAAARIAITSYLGAYGPATARTFDAWLTRGSSRSADVERRALPRRGAVRRGGPRRRPNRTRGGGRASEPVPRRGAGVVGQHGLT